MARPDVPLGAGAVSQHDKFHSATKEGQTGLLPAVDTLIVSDLHLGLPSSRPRDVLAVLQAWQFRRLILLGDIFHDFSFKHLCADTWRLLHFIRGLRTHRDAEIVWVLGNHDRHLGPLVAKLFGIETREIYRWHYGGRDFLALHGDRFDHFVSRYSRAAESLSALYAFTMRWLSRRGEWPRLLDRLDVGVRCLAEEVAQGARKLAQTDPVDVIVCGHTHRPLHRVFDLEGPCGSAVEYFNTGSWVERPASFVAVGPSGAALKNCP